MSKNQSDAELIEMANRLHLEAHKALVTRLSSDEQLLLVGRDCLRVFSDLLGGLIVPGPNYCAEEARAVLWEQIGTVEDLLARMKAPLAA